MGPAFSLNWVCVLPLIFYTVRAHGPSKQVEPSVQSQVHIRRQVCMSVMYAQINSFN